MAHRDVLVAEVVVRSLLRGMFKSVKGPLDTVVLLTLVAVLADVPLQEKLSVSEAP